MTQTGGKVPQFKLRPHPVVSAVLVLVIITGLLIAFSFFSIEDGTGRFEQRGIFTLVLTGLLAICLSIVATSRMWFSHLWKKNSTHERHRRHTRHHPSMREQEYRGQR